jgi:hypothetical protein
MMPTRGTDACAGPSPRFRSGRARRRRSAAGGEALKATTDPHDGGSGLLLRFHSPRGGRRRRHLGGIVNEVVDDCVYRKVGLSVSYPAVGGLKLMLQRNVFRSRIPL